MRYVGLDVHKQTVRVCILDAAGHRVLGKTIPCTRESLLSFAREKTFAVRVQGDGEEERVGATLINPAGQTIWSRPNLGGPEFHEVARPDNAPGEAWCLRLAKPSQGTLEDHYVEFRGVPALLSLTREGVLRPSK